MSYAKPDPFPHMDTRKRKAIIKACPHDWAYYDGALGYESRKCRACGVDWNDLSKEVL